MGNKRRYGAAPLIMAGLFLIVSSAAAEAVSVETALEKQDVYSGEAFVFQITVNGSDAPEQPAIQGFDDFDVSYRGGQNRSSQSITIINNRMQQTTVKSYIFQYSLTPKRTGVLTIPAVMVRVNGKNYRTDPVQITVREPEEVNEYKLGLSLSKATCYIGEPVTLTLTWYISASVQEVSFTFPLLNDKRFTFEDLPFTKTAKGEYVALPVNDSQLEFEHISDTTLYQGQNYQTISVKRILIPNTGGQLPLGKATVQFSGISGYSNYRDIFGNRQALYQQFVVPSNALMLTVKDVPAEGRPPNYSGLIGDKFSMAVSASPVEVKVGDPITLQLEITGPKYLNAVKIPDLSTVPELTAAFRIPSDQAPGKVDGSKKVFTQTLRALGIHVTEIPSFEIPYFNTARGKYDFMKSAAIPLKVEASDTKTFLDMEGLQPVDLKSEVETWNEGIASNYEGPELLKNQAVNLLLVFNNPLFILLLMLPVIVFLVLLYVTRFSHIIKINETDMQSRKAYARLMKLEGKSAQFGILLEMLNRYLGNKLKINSAALTFKDIEQPLAEHNVPPAVLTDLKEIYKTCEAGQYAGGILPEEQKAAACLLLRKTVQELERNFKK